MGIGIDANQGGPLNLQRSLAAWLHGTTGATYAASAALCQDDDGALKRFNQIYALAPNPEVRYAGEAAVDPYQLLREVGSPLLVLDLPTPGADNALFGEAVSVDEWRVQVSLFCAVYRDTTSGKVDGPRTTKQLLNAMDKLNRLIRYKGGTFPIYDFALTPPQTNRVGFGRLSKVMEPVLRADQLRCDWNLRMTYLRMADCAANV